MFSPPNWSYIDRIKNPLLETLQMSIVGTTIGALLAFPMAVLAASNFIQKPILHAIVKNILGIFRTIPALVLAALFVAIFGSGALPGVMALSIFSFGLIATLTYESIESIESYLGGKRDFNVYMSDKML